MSTRAHPHRPFPPAAPSPRHVAIIMDGNGRWAKKRFLPRIAGHKAGVEAVRKVTRAARAIGIEALTLYAFSSENWRRPEEEVGDLMGLLRLFIRSDLEELVRENVRLRIIGDYRRFAPDLVAMVDDAVARDRAQHRPAARDRVELRRASRTGRDRPAFRRAGGGRGDRSGIDRRRHDRNRARYRRAAAAGSHDSHLGRTAAVQFPALAGGLLPSCCSSTRCGPISMRPHWRRRSIAFGQRQRRYGGL